MKLPRFGGCHLFLFLLAAAVHGFADDVTATWRDIVARQAPAVVRVTVTIKQDMAAEGTVDAIGTVVDPSGIVVMARAELEPEKTYALIGQDGKEIEQKTEISKPVIHLADGTEVPARIALEDPDTGLACVVPEKPLDTPLACVPMGDGPHPRLFDPVVQVSRNGPSFGGEPSVRVSRITAVVTKPRRGYDVELDAYGPCFDVNGRCIGVTAPGPGDRSSDSPLIAPAADIADLVAQVKEQRGKR